ncbi:MAG: DUF1499 domain-containing protein [Promethearchaeota archaeon]|nr:MAG: DUF1499 domain-containing protein [Candidatus Lokiarchaeota archaeon]
MTKKPIGITNGKFHPCPKSPNCVSTQSTDERHKMEPIKYNTSLEEAKSEILRIINSLKRTRIKTETENYIHIEFRTLVFRFVDDVEFYFDDSEKIIHFRSAARLGYSDLGVNRKRMENITKLFLSGN